MRWETTLYQRSKPMNAEEALEIVERLLPPGTITSVQALVFRWCWTGKEYAAIAKEFGYNYGYIRDAGAQLWRSLSELLQEPVKKKTFRTVLQQRLRDQSSLVQTGSVQPSATRLDQSRVTELPPVPEGPVPLHSRFYIERPALEAKAHFEITTPGGLLRIKAPRKMGKSSLLLRVMHRVSELGYHTATLDFRQTDSDVFSSLSKFLRWFCANISHQLGLPPKLNDYWDDDMGCKASCTRYFTHYLLNQTDTPLVLALNEFDQVLAHFNLAREVLPLLRSWYEQSRQVETLQRLRVVLTYSADIYSPLELDQLSFNTLGASIELPEFDELQVKTLVQQYELGWKTTEPIRQLMSLVGGHPYLIQLALYHLWSTNSSLHHLLQMASTPTGVYSNYLQNYLANLQTNPHLAAALKRVMAATEGTELDPILSHQLEDLGLIQSMGKESRSRYRLYSPYFVAYLPDHSSDGYSRSTLVET